MRLIDADELCEKMHRMQRASATVEDIKSMRGFYGESVRRVGKWIRKRGLPYCSECDALAMLRADSGGWKSYHESEFCPYCGAKMEETECTTT
jgi:hypothetical protein